MQALCADQFGVPKDVLSLRSNLDLPQVQDTDVLIRVAYSDLNPVDLQKLYGNKQQHGKAIPNPPMIPGYSGSGIVEQVGIKVVASATTTTTTTTTIAKGDRVVFLRNPSCSSGSYATHIAVDYRLVAVIPNNVSLKDAATVPLAGCTAYESLVRIGLGPNNNNDNNNNTNNDSRPNEKENQTLLVVGAAGGVGSWTILLARAWNPNLKIIATASTSQSQQWCKEVLKANQVVTSHTNLVSTLGKSSVSHIICLTEPTPEVLEDLSEVIQTYGKLCLVVAGPSIQSLNLGFCFFKAVTIVLETVFSSIRTNFTVIQPSQEMQEILKLLADQKISAPLSLLQKQQQQQEEATNNKLDWKVALSDNGVLELLASGHVQGKLVMQVDGSL